MGDPLEDIRNLHKEFEGEAKDWPKSYKVYRIRNTFEIVAHSEEQARKRFDDLMQFLGVLAGYDEFPHPAVRYVRNPGVIEGVELDFEAVYESWSEVSVSMGSNMEYLFDWFDPDSDADYDPYALAKSVLFCEDEDDEE